jgi:hypothetical protein
MGGLGLSSTAIVRGDKAKLAHLYGPACGVIVRSMRALVRKRIALRLVNERRAQAQDAVQAAKVAASKAAAKKAAAGVALKAAAQKQRELVLEQLCVLLGSNSLADCRDCVRVTVSG